MSKGGGEQQSTTTTAQIPEEFLSFIFGPQGGGQAPADGGSVFQRAGQAFRGRSRPAGGQPAPTPTGVPTSGDGFAGVLPSALDLFGTGSLAPAPVFGEVSQQGQQGQLDLASLLSGNVLPQVQESFTRLGGAPNRSEEIANFATQQLQDQLSRNVLPSISQAAIDAGQFGSSRQGIAEGIAQSEAARNLAGVRSSILQQGEQIEQQGLSRQLAFAPQLAQLLGLPAGIVSAVGGQQDVLEQGRQGTDFNNLLRLSQLIQGFIPGASQTTIQEGGGPSALSGAAGGALTGASLGSAVPGIGTAIGAAGGGILGLLGAL